LIIGGFQRSSLIDYPDRISAVVFTQGCNFRCPYCFNPELVDPDRYRPVIPEVDILDFLDKRRGKLDAVVITGGEPTIQSDLLEFAKKIKAKSFLVKLDTNGSRPEIIIAGIDRHLFDFVALDIKAPPGKYQDVTASQTDIQRIEESIKIVIDSGIDHEFRTTVVKELLTLDDLFEIAQLIKGGKSWALQRFESNKVLDPRILKKSPYSETELNELREELSRVISNCVVR